LKEFFKRLGIIIYSMALVIGFFTLAGLWLFAIDSEISIIVFITKWLVVIPISILLVCAFIKLLYDGFIWLFIEPFKKIK